MPPNATPEITTRPGFTPSSGAVIQDFTSISQIEGWSGAAFTPGGCIR
jgi:hypothetical protein